jgi:hypothetical protein
MKQTAVKFRTWTWPDYHVQLLDSKTITLNLKPITTRGSKQYTLTIASAIKEESTWKEKTMA